MTTDNCVLKIVNRVRHVIGPIHHLSLKTGALPGRTFPDPREHIKVIFVHPELPRSGLTRPRVLARSIEHGPGEVKPRGLIWPGSSGPTERLCLEPGQQAQ